MMNPTSVLAFGSANNTMNSNLLILVMPNKNDLIAKSCMLLNYVL